MRQLHLSVCMYVTGSHLSTGNYRVGAPVGVIAEALTLVPSGSGPIQPQEPADFSSPFPSLCSWDHIHLWEGGSAHHLHMAPQ